MKRILIVDDDVAVTNYFMVFLAQTGVFDTTVINDSRQVTELIDRETFDVLLLDMDMPNVSGMDIMRHMQDRGIGTPVVVLTGVSDIDLAVRAMKLGAFDYLIKPVDDEKLLEVLDDAMEHRALHKSIEELPTQLTTGDLANEAAFEHFPTKDAKMIRIFHQAEKLAGSDLSIFIWGESGTGKEAIARAIHNASPRRDKPFVAVEADSQDPEHFPAFFFGQERTYGGSREERRGLIEEADGGTMFLNNIEYLTLPMQVRLKRVLQTGEFYRESSARIRRVNVRMIVSATRDLTSPECEESFSADLLYHLMVNSIKMPPLRERAVDIGILAEYFLREEAQKSGKAIHGFSGEALELLQNHSFPNNMQELKAIVAGAVAKEETGSIMMESLPSYVREGIEPALAKKAPVFEPKKLDDVVVEHVLRTLEHCRGDREAAARKLGIPLDEITRILEHRSQ